MATFVLIHGSWQASWCWERLTPLLESRGHCVVAPDLPGHGTDRTPLHEVTLGTYVKAIGDVVRGCSEPPILVAHSMGAAISALAEAQPDAVAALVYVAGLLPPNGSSMLDVVGTFDPAYLGQISWAADGRSVLIAPGGAREFLYPECPPTLVDATIPRLAWEPIAPYEVPTITSAEKFGRVPRYYVETLRDRVVRPELQKTIQAEMRFDRVFSLDADHSPFFSAPDDLASSLDAVAAGLSH